MTAAKQSRSRPLLLLLLGRLGLMELGGTLLADALAALTYCYAFRASI